MTASRRLAAGARGEAPPPPDSRFPFPRRWQRPWRAEWRLRRGNGGGAPSSAPARWNETTAPAAAPAVTEAAGAAGR